LIEKIVYGEFDKIKLSTHLLKFLNATFAQIAMTNCNSNDLFAKGRFGWKKNEKSKHGSKRNIRI